MKLLKEELKQKMPKLYTQEANPDPMVWAKFYDILGTWTWYATEFDGEDIFFGWVDGRSLQAGYFSLAELEGIIFLGTPRIERDICFEPCPMSKLFRHRKDWRKAGGKL